MGLLAGYVIGRVGRRFDIDNMNPPGPLTRCPKCKGPLVAGIITNVWCVACDWPKVRR